MANYCKRAVPTVRDLVVETGVCMICRDDDVRTVGWTGPPNARFENFDVFLCAKHDGMLSGEFYCSLEDETDVAPVVTVLFNVDASAWRH